MLRLATARLGAGGAYELAILNPDKPPLAPGDAADRLAGLSGAEAVWLTRAPTFPEKARIFPGATFAVGVDTLVRIAEPRYYGGPEGLAAALSILGQCRFLVFGRRTAGRIRDPGVGSPARAAADPLRRRAGSRLPGRRLVHRGSPEPGRSREGEGEGGLPTGRRSRTGILEAPSFLPLSRILCDASRGAPPWDRGLPACGGSKAHQGPRAWGQDARDPGGPPPASSVRGKGSLESAAGARGGRAGFAPPCASPRSGPPRGWMHGQTDRWTDGR